MRGKRHNDLGFGDRKGKKKK